VNLRIVILGCGGREHALAWRLVQDPGVEVRLAPGNAFAAASFPCIPVCETDAAAVVTLARRERADLVIVGPEAPLAAGVADALAGAGIAVFGPTREAARIESSKWFAKELMRDAGVPTARAALCSTIDEVERALEGFGTVHVVKADGLAAGKGVLVTPERARAVAFAEECLADDALGASRQVVIEEFLAGEELSVMAVTDGERFVILPPARDYKRAFDGGHGPNTGGMGAFAPVPEADSGLVAEIGARVVMPVLRAMAARGTPYQGTLYCGLMLGEDGVRVIEFNSRFGDPETEVIVPLVSGNLAELLRGAARGVLDPACVGRREGASVAVAIVDRNYPGISSGEAVVEGLDQAAAREGVTVFGGALEPDSGAWRVRAGRGAYMMAWDRTLAGARERVYAAVAGLGGTGWRCRSDIAAAVVGSSAGSTGTNTARESVRAVEI
jgi:phosphoribosylamine--glycine ligase